MPETERPAEIESNGHAATPSADGLVSASGRRLGVPDLAGRTRELGAQIAADKTKHVAIVIVVVLILAALGFLAFGNIRALEDRSPIYMVAIVGTVGGIANNYRKLTTVARGGTTTMDQSAQTLTTLQIYLSPMISSVFAILLYGIFLSGLLSGDFFPAFGDCAGEGFGSIRGLSECAPATNSDAAKALIWAFIAGFGENFVPNFIDGLAKHGGGADESVG